VNEIEGILIALFGHFCTSIN